MKYQVIGCGSSMGVPVLGCNCNVCKSSVSYNKRQRTSLLISDDLNNNIIIDTSADFKGQCLTYNITSVQRVLYTHFHADHIFGINELRAFAIKNNIELYANLETKFAIEEFFPYLFIDNAKRYNIIINEFIYLQKYTILPNFNIIPFRQIHGKIDSTGFIFNNNIAYCTDVNEFPKESLELLISLKLKVLFIGCIGIEKSGDHFCLDEVLLIIKIIKPEKAFLIHMNHKIEYFTLLNYLKSLNLDWIKPAHDGLSIEL